MKIDEQILSKIAEKSFKYVRERFEELSKNNNFSLDNFWKIKRKLYKNEPQNRVSVINDDEIEIFGIDAIKKEYEKEFKRRLDERKINVKYRNIENLTNKLFQLRLEICVSLNEETDFGLHELKQVLKSFQNGKSRDTCVFISELFKMGDHSLLTSILITISYIKKGKNIPEIWDNIIIQTIYKNKGSKKKLENYRGIFITSILSKILKKLKQLRIKNN